MTLIAKICLFLSAILISFPLSSKSIDPAGRFPVSEDSCVSRIIRIPQSRLNSVSGENLKIWVFFRDKGAIDKNDVYLVESRISEHARKRRQRNGVKNVTFADLPVCREYIDNLTNNGARLRRVSRWLNAASFVIDKKIIYEIAEFSFVKKITLVAGYNRSVPYRYDNGVIFPDIDTTDKQSLDYGMSYTQNNMINVPLMHQMGYCGQNVIIAMLDTGFKKSHEIFDSAKATNRIIAEYDFIRDDDDTQDDLAEDINGQHNHGTSCWSVLAGNDPGNLIGPAYKARFLLAKTEDIGSETPIEEDNWVAAMEWADSLGADIISSSLIYSDWYTYEDMDGATCITTLAANTAYALGILVVNSIGNRGPDIGTLSAPSDAFKILSCGAVDFFEDITEFSSRGPTYDNRIKPEVCAMGDGVYFAFAYTDTSYAYGAGTSYSAPLIAGAAAVLLSSNTDMSVLQLRRSLIETASQASSPDNEYGWGIIDVRAALEWGPNFTADTTVGYGSLTVQFTDLSDPEPTSYWRWYFGDGDTSIVKNPIHNYTQPGNYTVTLKIDPDGLLIRKKENYITVFPAEIIPGDVNNSGEVNILDVTYLVGYLYKGGPEPLPLNVGDTNCDGSINLLDITQIINYLYKGGPGPCFR